MFGHSGIHLSSFRLWIIDSSMFPIPRRTVVVRGYRPSCNTDDSIGPRCCDSRRPYLWVLPTFDFSDEPQEGINPITKASWYAVEWFGNAFGDSSAACRATTTTSTTTTTTTSEGPSLSLAETVQRIQWDNDRSYFLSGQVDELIYDPNCVFRDPFICFVGRDWFVTNLANLGSFITNYNAKVLEYAQPNPTTIQTKVCTWTSNLYKREELLSWLQPVPPKHPRPHIHGPFWIYEYMRGHLSWNVDERMNGPRWFFLAPLDIFSNGHLCFLSCCYCCCLSLDRYTPRHHD